MTIKTLNEWNKYFEDITALRDKIYKGANGSPIKLEMEDCNIIWVLLTNEIEKIFNTPLEFHRK